jgi:hypothetical protein
MKTPFDILLDKVAWKTAQGQKVHTKTLHKFFTYPIDSEVRHQRLIKRVEEFKLRLKEIEEHNQKLFERAMRGTMWETVGEPIPHNIKF